MVLHGRSQRPSQDVLLAGQVYWTMMVCEALRQAGAPTSLAGAAASGGACEATSGAAGGVAGGGGTARWEETPLKRSAVSCGPLRDQADCTR